MPRNTYFSSNTLGHIFELAFISLWNVDADESDANLLHLLVECRLRQPYTVAEVECKKVRRIEEGIGSYRCE